MAEYPQYTYYLLSNHKFKLILDQQLRINVDRRFLARRSAAAILIDHQNISYHGSI